MLAPIASAVTVSQFKLNSKLAFAHLIPPLENQGGALHFKSIFESIKTG